MTTLLSKGLLAVCTVAFVVGCTNQNLDAVTDGGTTGTPGDTTGDITDPTANYFCGPNHPYQTQMTIKSGRVPFHATGYWSGDNWMVNPNYPANTLTYGPYTADAPLGVSFITFRFQIDDVTADRDRVLWLDTYSNSANRTRFTKRELYRYEFSTPNQTEEFPLALRNSGVCDLEFRSGWTGTSKVTQLETTLLQPSRVTPYTSSSDSGAQYDDNFIATHTELTLAAWFKTTQNGTIFGQQDTHYPLSPAAWVDALYVGVDGKLHGSFWTSEQGVSAQQVSAHAVNDGKWHFAVLVGSTSKQTLYLDGAAIGTRAGTIAQGTLIVNQIGNGFSTSWASTSGGWFPYRGQLGEITILDHAWTAAEVQQAYQQ